jgi:hypothetical protein
MDMFLDVAPALARGMNMLWSRSFARTFLQYQQNAAPGRVCNGMKSAIKRGVRGHADYTYRENRWMSM